ncbi:MAG: serine hydrolase domain-containing protein [Saprospiraceae bacterium]
MKNYIFYLSIFLIFLGLGCEKNPIEKTIDCSGTELPSHPKATNFQAVLKKYVALGLPGISILIRDGNGIWTGSEGFADIDARINMKPCTVSKGASTTKTFIAALTLLMADEGKLSLDDKIEKFLPSEVVKNVNNVSESTIRMLLNHTTGIYDLIDDSGFYLAVLNNPPHNWTPDELIKFVYGDDPVFTAGADVEYSNTNYLLLAMILDNVSGGDHGIAMRQKILEPLGLENTYYYWHDALPSNVAQGYFDFYNNGTILNITNYNTGSGNGYGGMYSTVQDLKIFIEALVRDKTILSQSMLEQMLTFTKEDEGYGRANGLGVFKDYLERAPDQYGIGHRGRDLGYTADMYWFPNQDYTLTYLINYGTDAKSELRPVFFDFRKEVVDVLMQK